MRSHLSICWKVVNMTTSLRMHTLPHPGEILRQLCLEPLWLSVTEAAEGWG